MSEPSILFVDDEPHVLSSLERLLIRAPYQRRYAGSGQEALDQMAEHPAEVLVTDMRMPGMDGLQLLGLVKERWPETIRIALSAHTGLPQVLASINSGEVYRYLTKPLASPEEIAPVLIQALEVHRLRREQRELLDALATRNHELEEMLARIRRLEGMLPICCGCKKIRDDQGYWQQIEQYIREHADVQFSHGLCPDCAKRLYPDIFTDDEDAQS